MIYPCDLIISIDPGTTEMGWCVSAVSLAGVERIASGTERLGSGHMGGRLNKALAFLVPLMKRYAALHHDVWVAFEDVGGGGQGKGKGFRGKTSKATTRALGAAVGVIYQAAHSAGIPAHRIAPVALSTAKKHATDNGRAEKEEMMVAFETATGCTARKSDEADAYWIGSCLAAILLRMVAKPSTQVWRTISKTHADVAKKAKAKARKRAS